MKLPFKEGLPREMMRFVLIGGMATSLDLLLYLLLGLWISVSVSKFISMTCSCVFSFFMNRYWTFESKGRITCWQVARYIITQFVNIGINVSVNALLLYVVMVPKLMAFVIATSAAMLVNFSLQKLLVFRITSEKSKKGQ